MKKFLISFVVIAICSMAANAEDKLAPATAGVTPSEKNVLPNNDTKNPRVMQKRQAMNEKMKNASPEQKARMEKRREVMEKLSPEQKEAVKNEVARHRAEMKRITGSDEMVPVHNKELTNPTKQ